MIRTEKAALDDAAAAATASPIKTTDISIQESVDKVVRETNFNPRQAERLRERAGELCDLLGDDLTPEAAVTIAKHYVEEEEKASWEVVRKNNFTPHRVSPKKAANTSSASDVPEITGVLSAEQVNKQILARSRVAEFRPLRKFDEG